MSAVEGSMSDRLEIQTLGGLTITLDGQPVSGFASRKTEALLVYLACTRHAHPREVLAEMFWEERSQAQSVSNLRATLTSLRQQVGPYVDITRDTVGINLSAPCWWDAAEMEHHLALVDQYNPGTTGLSREMATRLQTATDLYRGDFLEGFYVDSKAFETWALLERERLRFRVMEALDTLIAHTLIQGDYSAGITHATRLLLMDSLREKTHRQLMMLLLQSGQREAALTQYEACRRLLYDEMGIEPTAETRALVVLIHAGEPPGTPVPQAIVTSPIPAAPAETLTNPYKGLRAFQEADAPDFFGRETLTQQLLARLAEDGPYSRFLAVVGPSGCGKSSVVRAGLVPALRCPAPRGGR
jgi:DNA-binding SARP family transcriptional activator